MYKSKSRPKFLSPIGSDVALSLNMFLSNKAKYNPLAKKELRQEHEMIGDDESALAGNLNKVSNFRSCILDKCRN